MEDDISINSSVESQEFNCSDIDFSDEESEFNDDDRLIYDSESENEIRDASFNTQPNQDNAIDHVWTELKTDPPYFEFRGEPRGVNLSPKLRTPGELIDLFLSDDFVNMMVQETNNYALRVIKKKGMLGNSSRFLDWKETNHEEMRKFWALLVIKKKGMLGNSSRFLDWKETNHEEMRKFWALLLHMGIIILPSVQHYWNTSHLYRLPFWKNNMTRNRFEILLRFLHFSDQASDSNIKLHKIEPVIKHFNNTMERLYNPDKDLIIDDPMILWRGRLTLRQDIKKNKKTKFGVKVYELCESHGAVLRILVDCGKSDHLVNRRNYTTSVVLSLMDGFLDKGHVIYTDSFYNSVALTATLSLRSTYICGILRSNRQGNPEELIKQKLKKGEHNWQRSGSVVVCKWRDRSHILTISNMHKIEMIQIVNQSEKLKLRLTVLPNVLRDYIKGMAGADRLDQMMSFQSSLRKTLRWHKNIAIHVVETMVYNAYVFYSQQVGHKLKKFLQFREEVILHLLDTKQSTRLIQSPSSSPNIGQNQSSLHYLDSLPPTKKKKGPTRQCKVCAQKNIRRETRYYCPTCRNEPSLCIGICYKTYHEQLA
uniref:PiggyBac transposable element-derived protein domain-containing protein n=1 Tax=Glossina brevipalpis TaxID=37001 RepID=A0A1A9WYG9_9MUSC